MNGAGNAGDTNRKSISIEYFRLLFCWLLCTLLEAFIRRIASNKYFLPLVKLNVVFSLGKKPFHAFRELFFLLWMSVHRLHVIFFRNFILCVSIWIKKDLNVLLVKRRSDSADECCMSLILARREWLGEYWNYIIGWLNWWMRTEIIHSQSN